MLHLFLTVLYLMATPRPMPAEGQPLNAFGDGVSIVAEKTTHPIGTPATHRGRQLLVGSGGGFTGFYTTYYLLDNGRLFGRRSRDSTYTYLGKQSVARTKRAFATVENTCRIKKTRFNNPGNTYRFVRWKKGKQEYDVTWGGVEKKVPAAYPKFYTSFMTMIPVSARL